MTRIFITLFLLCRFVSVLEAQPDTVKIGVFINDIYDINLSEKSFSTEFWVWFNYRDTSLHPLETLEIPNAKEVEYSLDFTEEKEGIQWAGKKVRAVVKKDWEIWYFPFDEQTMSIELEESNLDAKSVVYLADTVNTRFDTLIKLGNWDVTHFELDAKTHQYNTTYGDPTLSGSSTYPHASLNLTIRRKSWGLFFSLFTGLYVAFFISSLVFFIDPIDVDPRFGLSVGSLFAAVGNKYIVDSFLPQSTSFTLVDKIHILTYLAILICIIASVISLRIWKNGNEKRARKFDQRAYLLISISYLLINFVLIFIARYH